jgi:hypothetical protein
MSHSAELVSVEVVIAVVEVVSIYKDYRMFEALRVPMLYSDDRGLVAGELKHKVGIVYEFNMID